MDTAINDPVVVAEVKALHEAYEAALISNDVESLVTFFWDSALALRFGVAESLYGAAQITAFRQGRSPVGLDRTVSNSRIVTFGNDCAVVTLEFDRNANGVARHGRQSQVWRRFDSGWKIVSAHVSLVPLSYAETAASLLRLPLPVEYVEGVRQNIERAAAIAEPLLRFSIPDEIETPAVFQP